MPLLDFNSSIMTKLYALAKEKNGYIGIEIEHPLTHILFHSFDPNDQRDKRIYFTDLESGIKELTKYLLMI